MNARPIFSVVLFSLVVVSLPVSAQTVMVGGVSIAPGMKSDQVLPQLRKHHRVLAMEGAGEWLVQEGPRNDTVGQVSFDSEGVLVKAKATWFQAQGSDQGRLAEALLRLLGNHVDGVRLAAIEFHEQDTPKMSRRLARIQFVDRFKVNAASETEIYPVSIELSITDVENPLAPGTQIYQIDLEEVLTPGAELE